MYLISKLFFVPNISWQLLCANTIYTLFLCIILDFKLNVELLIDDKQPEEHNVYLCDVLT